MDRVAVRHLSTETVIPQSQFTGHVSYDGVLLLGLSIGIKQVRVNKAVQDATRNEINISNQRVPIRVGVWFILWSSPLNRNRSSQDQVDMINNPRVPLDRGLGVPGDIPSGRTALFKHGYCAINQSDRDILTQFPPS